MMRLIGTGLAVFAICGVLSAGLQGGGKAGSNAATPAKQGVQWTWTPIGSSEMTVEFPGASKSTPVPLDSKVRASYDILQTISYSSADFATFASYAVSKAQTPISLDGAARGALDNVKDRADAPDYKETITTTTVLGLPARKIQCSFTTGEDKDKRKMFLSGLIFTDRTRMWQVICTGMDTPANTGITQRVLSSIKRASSSD